MPINFETAVSDERLRAIPRMPGVYLMKDEAGTVIYIGKAKNLKNRVRSYFSGADDRYSIEFLLRRVETIETVVTESERQAIILEADLIRKYKPRYNIRLKDDKAYLIVRVNVEEEWPRLELVRSTKEDGALYLGPFAFAYELRAMLEVIKRSIPLRSCSDHVLRNRVRPCLEYQIKRCAGPCCLPVSAEQYRTWLKQAINILKGKNKEVIAELERAMEAASEDLRFEEAAAIRDRLQVLKKVKADSPEANFGMISRDAFGVYREGQRVEISVLMARGGRLFESKTFSFSEAAVSDEELISSFISQFYGGGLEVPEEVILPVEIGDAPLHAEILTEKRGRKVSLLIPKTGVKARLIALAMSNAKENFAASFSEQDVSGRIAEALRIELNLEEDPRTVECIDISHFQGGSTVGSVVAFQDGKPDKARYRHFILSQEGKPDDFASMREVVRRHLSRSAEENTLADLIVVDGGPAQLSQALKERKILGLNRPTMIGLAKKRRGSAPYRMYEGSVYALKERKPERIFREASARPLVLKPESEALHLLERIRNEAHRFAITFHRSRRAKRVFRSALDGIQGVGEKRKKELLKTFGSVSALREADPAELVRLCNLPTKLAERIVETLRQRAEKGIGEK